MRIGWLVHACTLNALSSALLMGKSCAARVGTQVQIHSKGTMCCPATTAAAAAPVVLKGPIALPWLSCHCPPLHLSASAAFLAPSARDGKGRGLAGSRRRLQSRPCSSAAACKCIDAPRTACRHCLLPPPALAAAAAAAAAAPLHTAPTANRSTACRLSSVKKAICMVSSLFTLRRRGGSSAICWHVSLSPCTR